ncbi:helix-turn-helix domain-containing protein [Klebsiella pneumoniae]|uniref:helix-turn-helix domain-containing protein n=1 Tax=Klebsiella pneumoniae TaxID=573 RepID=UPI00372D410A
MVAAGSYAATRFSQSDFENEIGNKSLVSRILSGERSLTLDHMRALANRFQIPVSMFVD